LCPPLTPTLDPSPSGREGKRRSVGLTPSTTLSVSPTARPVGPVALHLAAADCARCGSGDPRVEPEDDGGEDRGEWRLECRPLVQKHSHLVGAPLGVDHR
jgi:hypothetical protein